MENRCPVCKSDNPAEARFCQKCSAPLIDSESIQTHSTQTFQSPAFGLDQGKILAGRFEILEKIGEGGMGEVYRALDRTLDRPVAVKILPAAFAEDSERLVRFRREAKLLAVLNHTSIASIHGFEESEEQRFLILELAEGETLKSKLEKGPLDMEEALDICRQLAEGLEAAHEKGIIHRDFKPGNIMVTPKGGVKILDFGLAKAFTDEIPATASDVEKSPTITAQMTRPGVVLGTAAYMSPEQARGRSADKRTDIWAFGCVLYECLTGLRAFPGETVSDTLAQILKGEPDWNAIPASTPPNIVTLLRRCLRKNPRDRLHDIADARIEIAEADTPQDTTFKAVRHLPRGWIFALGAVVFAAGLLIRPLFWPVEKATHSSEPVASVIKLEPGYSLDGDRQLLQHSWPQRPAMALSRDGRFIVFCASSDSTSSADRPQLFLRRLGNLDVFPIEGTEGGMAPFLSPDDRWVGFWADGKLKKVPLEGGIVQDLCTSDNSGANWSADGQIVFAHNSDMGLSVVPAGGGEPEALTAPDESRQELDHRLPSFLPDSKAILFTVKHNPAEPGYSIALFDTRSREWEYLIEDGSDGRYVETGHIVFLRRGELIAVPFSLRERRITGQAVRIRPEIVHFINPNADGTAAGQFSISPSGSLIYAKGGIIPDWNNSLAWVDRQGNAQYVNKNFVNYFRPRLSPDGRMIVYSILTEPQIWLYDTKRDITYSAVPDSRCKTPLWSPDSKKIIYIKRLPEPSVGIFSRNVDGNPASEELILSLPDGNYGLSSISPDGNKIAFIVIQDGQRDIHIYDVSSKSINPFRTTPANEEYPCFSPDGRWLAYTSDKEGRPEIYVSLSSGRGGEIKISPDSGFSPLWAHSGKHLFYRKIGNEPLAIQTWAVDIQAGKEFTAGKPYFLFESPDFGGSGVVRTWDISLDDRKFLMVKREKLPQRPLTEIFLIQNWFTELERLVPQGK